MMHTMGMVVLLASACAGQPPAEPPLVSPLMLERDALEAGNPLATYAAMVGLEDSYLASPFAPMYPELKCSLEEFMGVPDAGVRAMQLPSLRRAFDHDEAIPDGFRPRPAIDVIAEAAEDTRIVIIAEEHHLPQTRSLYEPILRALWERGYRYLAAEAFTDVVMDEEFSVVDARSGLYLWDPVFASATRTAMDLGYTLVAYDTRERGEPGDTSFRDRTQAETLKARIFDRDPDARVVIFAGRGHASEVAAPDGWQPMAFHLRALTGIDPFTAYTPTMTARLSHREEHPLYRNADASGLLAQPTIFVSDDGRTLGTVGLDAYVFFPRPHLIQGRPDWLVGVMRRRPVPIPPQLLEGGGVRLVQAREADQPDRAIPSDQVLVRDPPDAPALMLPPGSFRVRAIDPEGRSLGTVEIDVP